MSTEKFEALAKRHEEEQLELAKMALWAEKQGSGGDIIDLWCDYHLIEKRHPYN